MYNCVHSGHAFGQSRSTLAGCIAETTTGKIMKHLRVQCMFQRHDCFSKVFFQRRRIRRANVSLAARLAQGNFRRDISGPEVEQCFAESESEPSSKVEETTGQHQKKYGRLDPSFAMCVLAPSMCCFAHRLFRHAASRRHEGTRPFRIPIYALSSPIAAICTNGSTTPQLTLAIRIGRLLKF